MFHIYNSLCLLAQSIVDESYSVLYPNKRYTFQDRKHILQFLLHQLDTRIYFLNILCHLKDASHLYPLYLTSPFCFLFTTIEDSQSVSSMLVIIIFCARRVKCHTHSIGRAKINEIVFCQFILFEL